MTSGESTRQNRLKEITPYYVLWQRLRLLGWIVADESPDKDRLITWVMKQKESKRQLYAITEQKAIIYFDNSGNKVTTK